MINCPWWALALTNLCAFALGGLAALWLLCASFRSKAMRRFLDHEAEMDRHKKELDARIARGCRQRIDPNI